MSNISSVSSATGKPFHELAANLPMESVPAAPHRTSIHWTKTEWDAVASYLFINHKGLCLAPNGPKIAIKHIQEAQAHVLPPTRHRVGKIPMAPVRMHLAIPLSKLAVESALKRERKPIERKAEPAPVPELQPAPSMDASQQEALSAFLKTEPYSNVPALLGNLIEALTDMIANKVVTKLQGSPVEEVEHKEPELIRKHQPQPFLTKKRRVPKIVILGPMEIQTQVLKKQFPIFEITGVENYSANLKDLLKSCDKVMLMADKISHSTTQAVNKHANCGISVVRGGVTSLRHQLEIWSTQFRTDPKAFDQVGK